jgi:radical SAM superfamily enzyme YgiQ (UPF0313 family)
MTDLLLIEAPLSSTVEEKMDVPPLGLAYIASVAEREGFSAEILDLNLGNENLTTRIKEASLIGISSYTQNYPFALKLLQTAREHGKKVVIGGPHATPLYKDALRDGFDYVVRGEGEYPILNLLKCNDDLRGVALMQNGRPKANFVHRANDLDTLPFPARHLLNLKRYSFPGAIATTRGCASHCIFCSSRNQAGYLRARGVDNLQSELESLQAIGLDRFFVIDPNFAFDKTRTLRFCEMVRRLKLEWFTELRLDQMDGEIIKAMAESGCRVVRFGIESGSQRIVDIIKKGISIEDLEQIVKTFQRYDIVPVCGFMIGHPYETKRDFEATLALAKKVIALGGEATFSILTPFPGTYLYKNAERLGIKILTNDWSKYHHLNPVIETKNFTAEKLRSMLFDALLAISRKEPINHEIKQSDEQDIFPLMEGVERRSFRNICRDV